MLDLKRVMTPKRVLIFHLLLLSILLLPGLAINYFDATSMMKGFVLSTFVAFFVFLLYYKDVGISKVYINVLIWLLFFILLHFFFALLLYDDLNIPRSIGSYFLLCFILIFSCLLASCSKAIESNKFHKIVRSTYYLLILLVCITFPLIQLHLVHRKSMIFFSEPSHFALAFGPFLLYMMVWSGKLKQHFSIGFVLGLMLTNLTLIVFALFALLILSKSKGKIFIAPFLFMGCYLVYLFFGGHFGYFLERVIISPESDNLSVLVLLSGYERAYLGLFDNYGLGVGFQQMGVVGPMGIIQEKMVLELNAEGLNVFSGGTFFSKIVVEFGVFGFIAVLAYVAFLPRVIRKIRLNNFHTAQELFYSSCFIMFVIVVFLRGPGYFSPSVLIFLSSIYWLVNMKRWESAST